MEKRWVIYKDCDELLAGKLAKELNIDLILSRILVKRGIHTFEQARTFFRPSLDHLYDPFLMKDMDRAVERIGQAIARQEKILIYGDYDVDGTTAVSLLFLFLKRIYPAQDRVDFYIPDRYKEGYGISYEGIDRAAENGFSLVIALDCGIKAIREVSYAREKGLDFIICDHHLPGDELPAAIAVLDPKRPDCTYPYKELSGCGIGFKLIQAFSARNGIPGSAALEYLDLVAVSIASDIVPVTGENRTLAFLGLQKLNEAPLPGLQALAEIAGISGRKLSIGDLAFGIGPRINAAGRMEHAKPAVSLLVTGDKEEALEKAGLVNAQNELRRTHDINTTEEALGLIESIREFSGRKSTVLFNPDWHKGVIGIVASRMIEKYYRPTVIFTRSNGMITGSARSVDGFDLYEAINRCSDLLEQFGGHKYAAGLTIREENLEAFSERFEEAVASTITEASLVGEIGIDEVMMLGDITPKTLRIIKQFAPFGPGNAAPVFCSEAVWCPYPPRPVGNNHLKFLVKQGNPVSGGAAFDCIGFGLGQYGTRIKKNIPFNICYTLEENNWKGRTSIQLNIKDIKI